MINSGWRCYHVVIDCLGLKWVQLAESIPLFITVNLLRGAWCNKAIDVVALIAYMDLQLI